MWVQSASKKVSFCLIILARVGADTLSANPPVVLTRLSASPGSYREVSPLVFHPLPKKQQRTRASGTRPAIQLAVRRTSLGLPEGLECYRKTCVSTRRADRWQAPDSAMDVEGSRLARSLRSEIGGTKIGISPERLLAQVDLLRRNTGSPNINTPRKAGREGHKKEATEEATDPNGL